VFCLRGKEEKVYNTYYVEEALEMLDGMKDYILETAEDWYGLGDGLRDMDDDTA
jgi:hypothetical protein